MLSEMVLVKLGILATVEVQGSGVIATEVEAVGAEEATDQCP
jgi:hypothetical protein